jgi:lipoprotein-releasing system ATP-binding protein
MTKSLSKFRNLNLGFQFHQLLPEFAQRNVCITPFIANKPKQETETEVKAIRISGTIAP